MSLFDRTNQSRHALRNAAPYRPATIGESLQSSWDVVAGTETSLAFHNMEYEMFERYRSDIEDLTGEQFYNPLDHQAHFTAEAPGGFELQMDQWFEDLQRLREKNPAVPNVTMDRLLEDIQKEREKLREQRADVSRRETSAGNTLAGFVGAMGAAVSDPLVLGSMAAGAPAASGVLRAITTEALIGAGSEVAVQGAVQATRDRLGEGVDFEQAATNILLAGAGGGILAGLFRGGAAGVRSMLRRSRELPAEARTPEVRASESFLKRKAEMEEASPFGPTLAGRVEHARRLDASMLNLQRPLRETLKGDTAVSRALPLDTLPDLPPVRASESLTEYVERVRAENHDLFADMDAASQRMTEVDQRLVRLDEELSALPEGDPALADRLLTLRERVADLEGQRQSTAVRRKLNRAQRNLAKLEENPEARAALARRGLERERTELATEAKDLAKRSKGLAREVQKVVKRTKRRDVPTAAHVTRAIRAADFSDGDKAIAEFMAEIGAAVKGADAETLPFSRQVEQGKYPARVRQDKLDVDPDIEKEVKDEARIDAELARAVEEDPDRVVPIEDEETGAVNEVTLRQLMEDLEEEQKLLDEFSDCIERTPV